MLSAPAKMFRRWRFVVFSQRPEAAAISSSAFICIDLRPRPLQAPE